MENDEGRVWLARGVTLGSAASVFTSSANDDGYRVPISVWSLRISLLSARTAARVEVEFMPRAESSGDRFPTTGSIAIYAHPKANPSARERDGATLKDRVSAR
jgi:hypothetical protein